MRTLPMMKAIPAAVFAIGVAFDCSAASAANTDVAALLDRMRMWEARGRSDLAREALEKLFRVARDHPDGLAALAEFEIRNGNHNAASQALDRLRSAKKDHPAIARIQTLLRLATTDKNKLRDARLLAKSGQTDAAVAALRSLYPDGPPSGDSALEYWQLVAETPNGREAAHAGLKKLAREHPENQRYRLALAEHETSKAPVNLSALRLLIEMSRLPAFARQADAAWRRAVMRLGKEPASIPLLREYVEHAPGDTAARERMQEIAKDVEEKRQLMADPAYQAKTEGLALLKRGNLRDAEEKLHKSIAKRPNDVDAIGGLGLVQLRQGRHGEAQDYFKRAERLDADNQGKWHSLARTARFWGLVRESKEAQEAGKFALAERKANEAVAIDSREPAALITLAQARARLGRTDEAEKSYRRALAVAPDSGGAFRGLVSLHLEHGDREGAERIIGALTPNQRRALEGEVAAVQAQMLREDAERFVTEGRADQAIAALEQAVALDEHRPWVKYDLARLYVRMGDPAKGHALLMNQVKDRPGDADSLHALSLFLSHQDDDMPALATLERIPQAERTDAMVRLQRRLWVRVQMKRASALHRLGRAAQARTVLLEAEAAAADDIDLLMSVALTWAQLEEHQHARQLVDTHDARESRSPAWRLRYGSLLARIGADDQLRSLLDDIAASPNLTVSDLDTLRGLRAAHAMQRAESLRLRREFDAAVHILQTELSRQPEHVQMLYAKARILRAMDHPEDAREVYQRILSLDPNDNDAYLALIDATMEAGDQAEAQRLIDEPQRRVEGVGRDDVDTRTGIAGLLIELEQFDRARDEALGVLAVAPEHPRALAQVADVERRQGRTDAALDFTRRSLASEWGTRASQGSLREISRLEWVPPAEGTQPMLIAQLAPARDIDAQLGFGETFKRLAGMLDQRTPWVSSAGDWRFRTGSTGMSRLDAKEVPIEWRRPWLNAGQVFLRADMVRLNSGLLNLGDPRQARNFGTVLLCQPACASGSADQSATGVSFAVGYERERLRLDLGTTPLGFAVQRVQGGVRYKGDLGGFSYSIDASSRPLTSSLLSYAGTRDPRTGAVWGGVQATGVRLGLSRDHGGAFGAWSSLGLHKLTGKNVQANDRMQFMAGAYWRVLNEDDRVLSVGVTAMLWRFRENAGEYTFGHGGYYSPQSYRSLSLPVSYSERGSRFSYALRAAVSVSRSDTKWAPFYPTDSALQATGNALAAISGVDPYYGGGSGRGRGYSVAGTFEYQLGPQTFVGSRLEIERSEDYAPNRVLFYTRYAFDRAAAQPVSLPPTPVLPTWEY